MKKKYIVILLCLCSLQLAAQTDLKQSKIDKQFDSYAYVDVIKTYENMLGRGYKSSNMLLKVANAYYFNGDLVNAAKFYTELFSVTDNISSEYYYRYAQSLKAVKEYDKANEMLLVFNKANGNDLRAKLAMSQKDYLAVIAKNSGRYTIKDAGINSKFSDYGSTALNGNLIFASTKFIGRSLKNSDPWTGEGFANLYQSQINADGSLGEAQQLSNDLNSKFHESTPAFTKDGRTVYFTRNNYKNGKRGTDKDKTTLLKIYKANYTGSGWDDVVELPFNSDSYSAAHPTLSYDEKTLFFASDMPGSLGQSDIFKVAINEDGTYGIPQNLGKVINTEGRETFPFITSNNELYFSSDGHPGLGGMDVFVSKATKDGEFTEIFNVGTPVNSPKDDFGFYINAITKNGFVTSNREGGAGGDDIYQIKEKVDLQYSCKQFLSGVVIDKQTGLPISDARVILYDSNYKLIQLSQTNSKGEFNLDEVDCGAKYYVRGEKESYDVEEVTSEITLDSGNTSVTIALDPAIKRLAIGDDIAKGFDLKPIYFDLYQYNIRPDAALELAKIYEVLIRNPKVKIEIRSHTDSRNDFASNILLSQRRADATKDWLVANGIQKSRLATRGYGESQLLNQCADDVPCTDAEHQINRRSEFIIISID